MLGTLVRFLVIFGWVGAAMAGQMEDFADSVRAIRSVGPEGRGNAEAAGAWKKLAGGDATTLVPILESMDGANDFGLNWLRAAVDAVAGRALSAGGSLPLPDLGMFLLETRHNPRARRLSFEMLAKFDPATADKLLTGMLNDPSLELRYDAVQKSDRSSGPFAGCQQQIGRHTVL